VVSSSVSRYQPQAAWECHRRLSQQGMLPGPLLAVPNQRPASTAVAPARGRAEALLTAACQKQPDRPTRVRVSISWARGTALARPRLVKGDRSVDLHARRPSPHGWWIPGRTPAQPSVRAPQTKPRPCQCQPLLACACWDASLLSLQSRAASHRHLFAPLPAPNSLCIPRSRIPPHRAAARALVHRVRFPQGGANLPPPAPALSSHAVPDTHT
jgi:hypothetical protein